jgi:acyl-CoA dehydrogenase
MGQLKLGLMHEREAFGAPLASKQTIQNFIADSAAEMDAACLMTLHAAWKMDRYGQQAARKEIGMIKYGRQRRDKYG